MKNILVRYFTVICILLLGGADATALKAEEQAAIHQATHNQKATATLIAYFESLVSKNILGSENLKHLSEQDHLINPIFEKQAYNSNEVFLHHKQINQMLEKNNDIFDFSHIKMWSAEKLQELQELERLRQNIHDRTRNIRRKAEFVALPAGRYVSAVDQAEFEIRSGIEIQDTPVTQYQWALEMGDNPSKNTEGPDSEEIIVGNKRITVRADYPVESVSFEQIANYIEKLNKKDLGYAYELPSVREYEALLQSALGKSWIAQVGRQNSCTMDQTCFVGPENFLELADKRIWDAIGALWQFTRDSAEITNEIHSRVVFGGSSNTDKKSMTTMHSLLRPVFYKDSAGEGIGFRLMRRKKDALYPDYTSYKEMVHTWNQGVDVVDSHWQWDKTCNVLLYHGDGLRFIVENKEKYSPQWQYIITELSKRAVRDSTDPVQGIKQQKVIELVDHNISDIAPLAYLDHITSLTVDSPISDVSALSNLINLYELMLATHSQVDISHLGLLTKLRSLELIDSKVTDITSLSKLVALRDLALSFNQITTIEPLRPLIKLNSLMLNNNQIKDITPLASLRSLSSLRLSNNQIGDINPLSEMLMLENLFLDNNHVKDITPLSKLSDLEVLSLSDNQITDISALSTLNKLVSLSLAGNPVNDLTPLIGLQNLEELYLDKHQIRRLTAHERLPDWEIINVDEGKDEE
jgi:formylglycine-generating enzyme required for sulfatase activity